MTCANCSAELTGEYCAVCGQRRVRPEDLSATQFVRDVLDEVASYRVKFKTLRTLMTLMVPGALTREFIEGRRRRYLDPLKVYLVCAALFFFSAPWAGFTLDELVRDDASGSLGALVTARAAARGIDPAHFAGRFDLRVQSVYTLSLGLGVIATALLLQLMSRRRHAPFGAQLVFALHVVSFQYLITALAGITHRLGAASNVASMAGLSLIAIYIAFALKRVYGGSATSIVLKTTALFLLTLAVNYAANAAAIRITLLLV